VIGAKFDAIDKQGNGPKGDLRTETDFGGLKRASLCKQEGIDIELQLEKGQESPPGDRASTRWREEARPERVWYTRMMIVLVVVEN
jgi:hypothetical protein